MDNIPGPSKDALDNIFDPHWWNAWLAVLATILAALTCVWRKTLRVFVLWVINSVRAPSRIHEIQLSIHKLENEAITAIGMARSTWDTLTSPVWQSDNLGMCIYANKYMRAILECEFLDVAGDNWKQFVHQLDKEEVFLEWESCIKENRDFNMEYRWISRTGVIIPIRAYASRILNKNKKIIGWVAFVDVLEDRSVELVKQGA